MLCLDFSGLERWLREGLSSLVVGGSWYRGIIKGGLSTLRVLVYLCTTHLEIHLKSHCAPCISRAQARSQQCEGSFSFPPLYFHPFLIPQLVRAMQVNKIYGANINTPRPLLIPLIMRLQIDSSL